MFLGKVEMIFGNRFERGFVCVRLGLMRECVRFGSGLSL